ncbi:linoleoyl-CoA desaturase activity protein [Modicella reniformis]|uniref:Linoleoyl-CoA desaturase activity protein n=1 Tax=Modicella reniformis TaxID=1440133 RepID=A0A9P6MD00_9FUNG|nr:linoleoyl-CoA desaturase activity protein [Modicella reniformis]
MHHKATSHISSSHISAPKTRSQVGLAPKAVDQQKKPEEVVGGEVEIGHFDEEAPIVTLFLMAVQLLFSWPGYLIVNASRDFSFSDFGILLTLGGLVHATMQTSFLTVTKYYGIPYIFVNFWLALIAFLQHTDPKLPNYREGAFNFQRGALSTVDRSYGKFLDHRFHGITNTHVVHHLFSQMPFYHAEEATVHLKKLLGKYYIYDDTPIAVAYWRTFRECRFVEDEGDVVFFKK